MNTPATSQKHPTFSLLIAETRQPTGCVRSISPPHVLHSATPLPHLLPLLAHRVRTRCTGVAPGGWEMGANLTHEMKSCGYIFPQTADSVPQGTWLSSSEYTQPILFLTCTAIRSYFVQRKVLPNFPRNLFRRPPTPQPLGSSVLSKFWLQSSLHPKMRNNGPA